MWNCRASITCEDARSLAEKTTSAEDNECNKQLRQKDTERAMKALEVSSCDCGVEDL